MRQFVNIRHLVRLFAKLAQNMSALLFVFRHPFDTHFEFSILKNIKLESIWISKSVKESNKDEERGDQVEVKNLVRVSTIIGFLLILISYNSLFQSSNVRVLRFWVTAHIRTFLSLLTCWSSWVMEPRWICFPLTAMMLKGRCWIQITKLQKAIREFQYGLIEEIDPKVPAARQLSSSLFPRHFCFISTVLGAYSKCLLQMLLSKLSDFLIFY